MTCNSDCKMSFYEAIMKFYENNDASIAYLKNHGVLPSEAYCPKCKTPCNLRVSRNTWECNRKIKIVRKKKKFKKCTYSLSLKSGTFLENANLDTWKVVLFINEYIRKDFNHERVMNNLKISSSTSVDWKRFANEVCDHWFEKQEPIGGPNIVVEIEQFHFGKQKCRQEREGQLSDAWVFGGIERVSKNSFFVPLIEPYGQYGSKRDAATLIPIIQKYIQPGSIINSEMRGAYSNLQDLGYTHNVNHSENFVSPSNSEVHTQNIKRLWRDLTEWTKRPGTKIIFLKQYLSRYLFLHNIPLDSRLHSFFVAVKTMYFPGLESQKPWSQQILEEEELEID